MRYLTLILVFISSLALGSEVSPYDGPFPPATKGYQIAVGKKVYDLPALEQFPQYKTHLNTIWEESGEFVGPKLIDVLNDAGINHFSLLYMEALNDYSVTVRSDQAGLQDALLAYQFNGKLLSLNEKGPFWLIWPQSSDRLLSRTDNGTVWIWNLSLIDKVE